MQDVLFKVVAPRVALPQSDVPIFVLQQDNWNDFSFRTQYQLYYYSGGARADLEKSLIGSVKILKRGQRSTDPLQVSQDFTQLGVEFCSVGDSLDYYERLSSLGPEIRRTVLHALRDVVQDSALVSSFSSEAGWGTSLFRGHQDDGASFRQLAESLMTGDYTTLPKVGLRLEFKIPEWQNAASFEFRAPDIPGHLPFPGEGPLLPGRISVLIGRNGTGKSTLLARLARVAFGTVGERAVGPLTQLGEIAPSGIGFPRVVNVAFSPFDSFKLPGSDAANQRQLLKELERGEGRFVFIGLRDIVAELSGPSESIPDVPVENLRDDHQPQTRLKSVQRLADEFRSYLEKIQLKGRQNLLSEVWPDLLRGSAFSGVPDHDVQAHAASSFATCSTGHKVVLLIATGLIANIEPQSLVLIDEPETHLHPPLLAALMHALRRILDAHASFAIVATHSPVVIQESLARHVQVVRRDGDMTTIKPVGVETFGENIGLITAEVFGLQSDTTDFHKSFDRLVEKVPDLERIEALFLGNAMSHQGRAYVMAKLAARAGGKS